MQHEVAAGLVDPALANTLGKTDASGFCWMAASCGQHFRYITIKGAHQRPSALRCKLCKGHGQPLSSYAMAAALVIAGAGERWAYEARVLGGQFGPMDFVIPSLRLAVEIDGEQHYGGGGWGKEQQRRDKAKMAAAWHDGWRVLRVPYFYADGFALKLQEAMQVAAEYPKAMFIMWAGDNDNKFALLQWRGDTSDHYGRAAIAARAAERVSESVPCTPSWACPCSR